MAEGLKPNHVTSRRQMTGLESGQVVKGNFEKEGRKKWGRNWRNYCFVDSFSHLIGYWVCRAFDNCELFYLVHCTDFAHLERVSENSITIIDFNPTPYFWIVSFLLNSMVMFLQSLTWENSIEKMQCIVNRNEMHWSCRISTPLVSSSSQERVIRCFGVASGFFGSGATLVFQCYYLAKRWKLH